MRLFASGFPVAASPFPASCTLTMCGRFTLSRRDREELAYELGVPIEQLPADVYRPRYNIAPTDPHWIVRVRYEDRELLPAKWGLVNNWAKDAKRAGAQINARSETLAKLPPFRDAFRRRRCVIPADGFFEWTGAKDARQPLWFHRADGQLLLFAGLYESWEPAPGERQRTFTIVTTGPNGLMAPVHDRMPVILTADAVEAWLNPRDEDVEELSKLLVPAPEGLLIATPMSSRVNSVKNDDEACLVPAAGGRAPVVAAPPRPAGGLQASPYTVTYPRRAKWTRHYGATTNQTPPTFCPFVSPALVSRA